MISLYIVDNKASQSSVYGIGTYINQLAITLRKCGLNACFIHLNSNTQQFFQEIEYGIAHWYVPLPKLKYTDIEKHDKLYFQNVAFILRQYIQPNDNVVFHLNYLQCKPFADTLKAYFNCKIVLAIHFFSWCFDISGNVSRLKNILAKSESNLDQHSQHVKKSFNEEKELLCSVDKVICLSNHTAGILQKIYQVKKQNISIIYNGLEDMRHKEFDRKSIYRKYNLPMEVPVIIFAGRLDQVKGLAYFIQASKIVLDQIPNCQIIIAGSGDYHIFMKERGNKWMNIHFSGLLEKKELYELYSIADFGVMPSFHEQCSYVAIEMMMYGLPIIGSTSTGLSEMIDEGVTGLHVPVEEFEDKVEIDVILLAEKILYLLENESVRKQMSINARRRYETMYTSEIFSQNMLKFYQSLYTE